MNRKISQIFSAMLARERRAVSVIALIAVFRMFGLFALLPVLSIYARDLDSATPLLIGLAVGGYGLTQAVLQIPYGAVSDRIGRVPVILFGLFLFAAGSILAAESTSIYGLVSGRLLQGAGAISATLSALLADATREEMRTRSMAMLGIGIGSSFLLAFIIGPTIAAAYGVRALFWIAAILAVLAAGLLRFLPPGIERPAVPPDRSIRQAIRSDLIRLDVYVFLLHALLTASFVALPFLLTIQLQIPLGSQWKIYIGALALSLVGTIPLILADERQGKSATVGIAVLLLLLAQAALAFLGTNTGAVLLILAVFFAGFNFLEAALPARLSIQAAGEVRGASLGVFASFQFLGAFAGGLLGGQFLGGGNPSAVFLAGAILCALWMLLHRVRPSKAKNQ